MFRKLRIQFIAVVMVSVALVLAIVFSAICVNEYRKSVSEVDNALSSAIERASNGFAGKYSDNSAMSDDRRPRDAMRDFIEGGEGLAGPEIGGRGGDRDSIVPVAVYMVMEDKSYTAVGAFTTAQIDSEVLADAASRINDLGDGSGTLGDLGLHYQKRTTTLATYVAFADTSSTDSWKSLAASLAVAARGLLVVFFFISYFLSNWALKPVKEAWESQRQFVADASHELKTPLTVILANNSILMKHSQDTIASQSQWVESTQAEAVNMQGLVRNHPDQKYHHFHTLGMYRNFHMQDGRDILQPPLLWFSFRIHQIHDRNAHISFSFSYLHK